MRTVGRLKRVGAGWAISSYLMALALATALPVVGCAALLAYQFVGESSRLAKAEYEDRLRLMRNATKLRLANIIEDLQVLALSPALAAGNFAEFKEHASRAVELIGGVGKKRRAGHLATFGAVAEPTFVGLVIDRVADGTAQAASFSENLRSHDLSFI